MEIQAVKELFKREAQSPSKDDYKPPGNRGFFIWAQTVSFPLRLCGKQIVPLRASRPGERIIHKPGLRLPAGSGNI